MVLLTVVFAFLVCFTVLRFYGDSFYTRAALLALFGHAVVVIFLIEAIPYDWDFGQFHTAGQTVVDGGLPEGSTVAAFGAVQGFIYAIFGNDPKNVGIISSLLAVLVPIPIRTIAAKLYGSVRLDGLTALVLFLPLPFLFLSLPMRDATGVFLLFSLLAVAAISITEERYLIGLLGVPLWGMLYLVRPELGAVSILAVTGACIIAIVRRYSIDISIPVGIAILGGLGTLGLLLFSRLYPLASANAELSYRAQGGAVYLRGMQYSSWFDMILATPGRALYFLFAPFPLHVDAIFHAMALLATAYVVVFVIAAVRSLRARRFDPVVATILGIAFLAGIAGYGVINSNFGTNVRHRVSFVFLLLVFATPVIERWELAIRQWLGKPPDEHEEYEEEYQKAEEFDRYVHS